MAVISLVIIPHHLSFMLSSNSDSDEVQPSLTSLAVIQNKSVLGWVKKAPDCVQSIAMSLKRGKVYGPKTLQIPQVFHG